MTPTTDHPKGYPCPADAERDEGDDPLGKRTCGEVFSTLNGAVSHAFLKDDGEHPHTSRGEAADALDADKAGGGGRPPKAAPDRAPDGGDEPDEGAADARQRRDPEVPPADEGATEPGVETEDCPACGADLGHSLAEIRQFIAEHGGARCEECDTPLRVEDDA